MNADQFNTLTFAAVAIPALFFALWKAWLAILMKRGTHVRTEIGAWLIRLYSLVATLTFIIGVAYLMTVSDREGWFDTNFLHIRQGMRIGIGILYLTASVAAYVLWRNVQELERRNGSRDVVRDAERDAARDIDRDITRDEERDSERDMVRDVHVDIAQTNGNSGGLSMSGGIGGKANE